MKIKASKTIRIMVDTYYFIIPSLLNILLLIFLMIFIYSILGMNLFAGMKLENLNYGAQSNNLTDFSTFGKSLISLMQFYFFLEKLFN